MGFVSMEMDIIKLVYDYSRRGKYVDLEFIHKLINIVVSYRSLNSYVRSIKVKETLEDEYNEFCAAYSPFEKSILLNYSYVHLILENGTRYDDLFQNYELIMYKNLIIAQILLHELEHANQHNIVDKKGNNTIECDLIRASFYLEQALKNPKFYESIIKDNISVADIIIYIKNHRELYKQYYRMNPTERMAQVNSYNTIVKSIEPVKEYFPALYEFKKACLVEQMLQGYEESWFEGSCPTQVYLYGTRQCDVWKRFKFYNEDNSQLVSSVREQHNLAKRLTLGLPITEREYYNTNDWLQSTNKFNF